MPLYEYVCSDCNTRFDALVSSFNRADSVKCRSCSGDRVKRQISTFATVGGYDDEFTASEVRSGGGGCCGGSCGCGH
jgi:putative FmdB family regulatory protein